MMKCRDCEHWGWGDDEGTHVWGWCWIRTSCPDPDIGRSCPDFLPKAPDISTALSTLQAENEKLRSELEQVKRERDTAVEDLRVCSIENNMECQYCLYRTARSFCWNCTDGSNWTWRSPQRED